MGKNNKIKDQSIPGNDTLQSSAEAAKTLADLGKEVLKTGEISEGITKADQQSSSEYLSSLKEILTAINQEIKECKNLDERSMLYRQREDVMNRMKEEKENQRHYNDNREDKNRNHSRNIFASVAAVALGAGGIATKILLENKRN
ncbi:gas vesicle protein [Planomicrobium sp. HSC-17F08]|nr:gas vesicle protein [Planomicrobium sp. HSC-17F08]